MVLIPAAWPLADAVRRAALALVAAALLPAPGAAASRFVQLLAPDLLRLQVGGGQGMISGGPGYRFWDNRVQAEGLYGYAPASLAGTELHALSQKTTLAPAIFRPRKDLRLAPILGYSANVAIGENYFLVLSDRYQDYYWPSALRFWIFAGMRVETIVRGYGPLRSAGGIAEVGAHDVFLQAWYGNASVEAADVLSLSLALQLRFRAD